MSDDKNSNNNSNQETVTVTTEDPKRIEELEKLLDKKDQEIQQVKQKTSDAIKRIKEESKIYEEKTVSEINKIKEEAKTSEDKLSESKIVTNLPARIIKQNTFGGSYKNGYEDGTVEKAAKEIRSKQRKARVGK